VSQYLGFVKQLLRPLQISDLCLLSLPFIFDHSITISGALIPGSFRRHKLGPDLVSDPPLMSSYHSVLTPPVIQDLLT
jgi:hypothetical protein